MWRSQEIAPTVVPKLSAANGIVYTYTKDPQPDDQDAWYLTALDFRTGKTLFKRLGGEGLGHNNNYAPITLGPDGTAYVGVLGGLIGLRDATPPPGAAGGPPAGSGGKRKHGVAAAEGPAAQGRPAARCTSSARACEQVRRVDVPGARQAGARGPQAAVPRDRRAQAAEALRPHEGRRADRAQGRHARQAGQARPRAR